MHKKRSWASWRDTESARAVVEAHEPGEVAVEEIHGIPARKTFAGSRTIDAGAAEE
jgi:hypothetical protein